MQSKGSPMPRVDDFKNTLEIAREEFKEKDPQVISLNSGADYQVETNGAFLIALYQSGDQNHLA